MEDNKEKKEKKIPTPEDIQNDFEEFFKDKYGESVKLVATQMNPSIKDIKKDEDEEEEHGPVEIKFDFLPKDIKAHLDRYVIKQDEAKKALSIAVCDHYNHVKDCLAGEVSENDLNYSKQNVLMLGPTGVGKTYLIRHVAKFIGVPFVKADATRFSETGYVGGNVEDMIRDLVTQAKGNYDLAKYGIVYIDEIDKLATPENIVGRDVTGRGVQMGLLKLMEETDVDLRAVHDMASQLQAFMEFQKTGKIEKKNINTRHILFIVSGAFNNVNEIIQRRLHKRKIGIQANGDKYQDNEDWLQHVISKDLIKFGLEPEFVGRLPVRVSCTNLSVDDLYNILKTSEGSLIRQYEQAFKSYGIEVTFTDEALRLIAEQAAVEKTGARALMIICERILRDYKFELPSSAVKKFEVTKRVIENPKKELDKLTVINL